MFDTLAQSGQPTNFFCVAYEFWTEDVENLVEWYFSEVSTTNITLARAILVSQDMKVLFRVLVNL